MKIKTKTSEKKTSKAKRWVGILTIRSLLKSKFPNFFHISLVCAFFAVFENNVLIVIRLSNPMRIRESDSRLDSCKVI